VKGYLVKGWAFSPAGVFVLLSYLVKDYHKGYYIGLRGVLQLPWRFMCHLGW
jgi:hypothetical protein